MKVNTDSRLGRKLAKRDVLIGSSPRGLRNSGVTFRKRLATAAGRRAVFDDGTAQEVDAVVWTTLRTYSSLGSRGSTPAGLRSLGSCTTTLYHR